MLPAEKRQILVTLDALTAAVDELLLIGLTTASKATIERLDLAFRETSRLRLLRLGSTLRIANEEIARFTASSPQFSPRRLAFFLGRAALLASAMRRALHADDLHAFDLLLATPPALPVDSLHAVVLGVAKRVVPGAFAAFDFRLRILQPVAGGPPLEPAVWSCVFPMRKDADLPAEAYLHLPQKQKFKPAVLLEKRVVQFSRCAISRQPLAASRLSLADPGSVALLDPFTDWPSLWAWDLRAAAQRLENYTPNPLDLEIEFQEEVFLHDWKPQPRSSPPDEPFDVIPVLGDRLPLELRIDRGPSGQHLGPAIDRLAARRRRPPLFGLLHYEACRLVLQPLASLLPDGGVEYLTISPEKVSQAQIVKAMKFN